MTKTRPLGRVFVIALDVGVVPPTWVTVSGSVCTVDEREGEAAFKEPAVMADKVDRIYEQVLELTAAVNRLTALVEERLGAR